MGPAFHATRAGLPLVQAIERMAGGDSDLPQVLSTDSVMPRERVAFWQDMVCETFVQAACDSRIGESFRGRISSESFDSAEVSRIESDTQRIHRRAVDVARSDKPRFYLCQHLAGHARYRTRGQDVVLGPGDMILLDNCEPYVAEFETAVNCVVLHVPQQLAEARLRDLHRATGQQIRPGRRLSAETGRCFSSGLERGGDLSADRRIDFAHLALSYFDCATAAHLGRRPDPVSHHRVTLARIHQALVVHLKDPDFNIEQLSATVGLTARHVRRVFHRSGSNFGRELLRQRIECSRKMLESSAIRAKTIGEIALDCGFNNFSHFSRVFRQTYGCSPSEFRATSKSVDER